MKAIYLLLMVFSISGITIANPYKIPPSEFEDFPVYSDDELSFRVQNLNLCFEPIYTKTVKSYLNTYTINSRGKAKKILGKIATYFPMIEAYLAAKGLPDDLKYLAIVESALTPTATSRSDAKGLWQFMSGTAKDYDLEINTYVDERLDIHKSTNAALTYLEKLYRRFGSWELALAAYNGGPGRVSKAIRKAGGKKDFWKIKKYLPRETQNYISAYVAAAYLVNFYYYHNLEPIVPSIDKQLLDHVPVLAPISFAKISNITGVPPYLIQELNPSFKKNVLPYSPLGNIVVLPNWAGKILRQYTDRPDYKNALSQFKDYQTRPISYNPNTKYRKLTHIVQPGENLGSIARKYGCHLYNIKTWNNIYSYQVKTGQSLVIFTSNLKAVTKKLTPIPKKVISKIPILVQNHLNNTQTLISENVHVLKLGQTLKYVAMKYKLSLTDLLIINNISPTQNILPGTLLVVKK